MYTVNTNFEDLEERGWAHLSKVKEGGGAPVSSTIPHLPEESSEAMVRNRKPQVADPEAPSFAGSVTF